MTQRAGRKLLGEVREGAHWADSIRRRARRRRAWVLKEGVEAGPLCAHETAVKGGVLYRWIAAQQATEVLFWALSSKVRGARISASVACRLMSEKLVEDGVDRMLMHRLTPQHVLTACLSNKSGSESAVIQSLGERVSEYAATKRAGPAVSNRTTKAMAFVNLYSHIVQ